jgi:Sulfotransferase family
MHPLIDYDMVGRLETFDADLARVRELAGLPEVPLKVRNERPPTASMLDGRPNLLRRVREVYARDFELYGY